MTILTTLENTPEAWSLRADQHDDPWTACGWTEAGQLDRMEAILEALDPQPGERLLDWGCGTGALSDFMPPGVLYTGYDSAEGMISRAQRDHPRHRFQSWAPPGPYDHVACIGPFNLPDRWSKQHTWSILRGLFDQTERRLVASLYAGTDEVCLSYSLEEADRFAKGQGFRAYADAWRHNDILVVLER